MLTLSVYCDAQVCLLRRHGVKAPRSNKAEAPLTPRSQYFHGTVMVVVNGLLRVAAMKLTQLTCEIVIVVSDGHQFFCEKSLLKI